MDMTSADADRPTGSTTEPGAAGGGGGTSATAFARGRLGALALLAAVLAGAGAWLVGESGVVRFRPGQERVRQMGGEMIGASPRTRAHAALQDASAIFGISGGLLGGALGLAGGWARGPGRWAWGAATVGLVLGAVAGAVPPWIVIPLANRTQNLSGNDLGRSILVHTALWVATGAAAGLALGMGLTGQARGRAIEALLGGALGAFVGIAVYDLVGALVFPLAGTGLPISATPTTRLLARSMVALGASVGASALLAASGTGHARAAGGP
jgi:hypothetical protein